MNDPQRPCDLCALPVGARPFSLDVAGRVLEFCCEGCLGIYQMLNDIKDAPSATAENVAK